MKHSFSNYSDKQLNELNSVIQQELINRGLRDGGGKQPKTSGLEWLWYSFTSFNGMQARMSTINTPEEFVESYIEYKESRKKLDAVQLVKSNYDVALEYAQKLLDARYY